MEFTVIALAAFLAAVLTFFSGFGLGTILAPVFMLFFPVELAIAMTGVVHFCSSLFKLFLVGGHADKMVLLRFGIPAVLASFAGAWVLVHITELEPLFTYELNGKMMVVTPVKFTIAILLIFFALMDLLPVFKKMEFSKDKLPVGGLLSGFFGGLSGNQGALRSAFLIRAGLTKEAFIATGVVISCFVDFTRLSVYAGRFLKAGVEENLQIVIIATVAALLGAVIGNKLLKKVTLKFIQAVVAVLLILISIGLGAGFL
ncbi:MAG TPA: sulfite exporter TauE/SafE family protein [Bacteroidia bacterium]|nr:sulfite exporter TauE/SafE family protein [Bacteroidia bacterium]